MDARTIVCLCSDEPYDASVWRVDCRVDQRAIAVLVQHHQLGTSHTLSFAASLVRSILDSCAHSLAYGPMRMPTDMHEPMIAAVPAHVLYLHRGVRVLCARGLRVANRSCVEGHCALRRRWYGALSLLHRASLHVFACLSSHCECATSRSTGTSLVWMTLAAL